MERRRYATTIHSSQGRTTERVFIEAESDRKTTAKDTFYVALSRARAEARVYTDDFEKLPKAGLARDPQAGGSGPDP